MKTLFVIACLIGFLYFCQESATFATNLQAVQAQKIETALNQ